MNDKAEAAHEDYQYARVLLAETESAIEVNTAKLTRAEEDLVVANERLERRVNGIYRNGRVSLLEALLGAESFTDFVNRLELLNMIGVQDGDVLEKVSTFRADVAQRKEQLAADQALQAELLEQAKRAKVEMESRLAERERLLAGKEREVAQLEREEEERQARVAEEARVAAARAAEVARQQAAQSSSSGGSGSSSGSGSSGSSGGAATNVPSSSVGASAASVAMRYIGVPYVWGGESPSGFDCSGLVKYSFAQVGVSLPHSSRALYGYGVAVSRGNLQPGDLVFFGSPIHHVGIYVGNGNMVHAPYTGANVRVSSISRSNYTGARRIM
ncbi:MAG: C40 family peptidase [Actinobacteria bacterium]|nr:C40 family peptidase [Actinomycetota bacterium]